MIRTNRFFWERSLQESYECPQPFSFHNHQGTNVLNFNPQSFDYKAGAIAE